VSLLEVTGVELWLLEELVALKHSAKQGYQFMLQKLDTICERTR
jgi:hypothetical protein